MNDHLRLTLRTALLAGVGLSSLMLTSPAWAEAPAASAAAAGGGTELTEVIVTARRQAERMIDVPVAATTLTQQSVERYASTTLQSLATNVPGLVLDKGGGGTNGASFSIRGVGNLGRDFSNEQPVAMNIDGVQITRGRIASVGLFDVSGVEVLKGPQALFFGKNSPAGVVSVTSQDPGQVFGGYGRISYEFTTHTPLIEGAFDMPVSDKLAFRLAARFSDMSDGYLKNKAGPGIDPFSGLALPGAAYSTSPNPTQAIVRLTAVYNPIDDLHIVFKSLFSREDLNSISNQVAVQCAAGFSHPMFAGKPDPYDDCHPDFNRAVGQAPTAIAQAFKYGPANLAPFNRTDNVVQSLNASYQIGDITLTSVTGFYWSENSAFDNSDNTSLGNGLTEQYERTRQYTQEFRAVSNFQGPVNFTAGTFFQTDNRYFRSGVRTPGNTISTPAQAVAATDPRLNPVDFTGISNALIATAENSGKVYSAFGQARWKIIPTLELAAGARWTQEKKESDLGAIYNRLPTVFSPAGYRYHPTINDNNVSPEATLTWKPTIDITTYVAYKTGFLSGGVQNPAALSNIHGGCLATSPGNVVQCENDAVSYKPEKVKGYEGGVKGYLLDHRLLFDLNLYHYKFTNLQVTTFNPDTLAFLIQNAGGSTSEGGEFQLQFKLNEEWQIRSSLAYTKLKYTTYSTGQCFPKQPLSGPASTPDSQRQIGQCYGATSSTGEQFLNGATYGGSPLQADLGADYTHEFSNGMVLSVSADQRFYSRQPRTAAGQPWVPYATGGEAHWLTDASIRLSWEDAKWEAALIGTNLTNDFWYPTAGARQLGNTTPTSGDMSGTPQLPREITLQLTHHF